ncbi:MULTISPECIES: alpha/beta fold hydrolase [Sphingobium]|uniref:Alpha/beta hydrolase n=1 Tax=Sphingobium cupriresistens LL01 TaxID=1420583 RepID=A0A0J8AE18_9SPHN|nr:MULTISPECIES: alpha/beta hydrolase [Sphingobium]KMS53285.1 alpha/beta hydrolase [Sphingobium cupriresistens LL01]MBJ7375231.1 alpha/beta hydrolase [Sphingobium sp.]
MSTPAPLGPTSHSFVSQRLRLNYLDWGNAAAPTLILVHGGRDHARSWDQVAQALRDDWHIICPDLRGHGDSAWSPDGAYTMPYFICDLAQLIHQQGDAPVTIVAHSLGGAISLRYAGLYPERVRKLVAIEGLGLPSVATGMGVDKSFSALWRDWIEERRGLAARQPRRYASIEEALARMQGENSHLSEAQARHLTIHGVARNEDGSFSWKFDNYVRSGPPVDISPAELHALWGAITCPTLLCYGNDSWAENPSEAGLDVHFRDASVQTFDHAGHWLHHDQFDQFIATLRAFL